MTRSTDAEVRVNRGTVFPHPSDGGDVRVMTVCDNYAMVRRPGCIPFVMPVKKVISLLDAALTAQETTDD